MHSSGGEPAIASHRSVSASGSPGTAGDSTDDQGAVTERLEQTARAVRRHIVTMTTEVGSGHPGGSLSGVEITTALYFAVMRHRPTDPHWADRDKFVLSKGHASPLHYAVLAEAGYFPVSELKTFRRLNSRLQGHVHIKVPGVEFSTGSLGQGLSFGIGLALANRLDHRDSRVYVLLGDGECDEGQVWEAAMSAAHHKVDNLTAIVDRNRIQNDRWTHEAMDLEPLPDKWRAFGWKVLEVDGHSFPEILAAYQKAKEHKGGPTVIIARTIKGKGVSFMENNADFHGKAATKEQLAKALVEIG